VRAHRRMPSFNGPFLITLVGVLGGLLAVSLAGSPHVKSATLPLPSRSTTIALTSDETRLVVVNREANTISIIRVKNAQNNDVSVKLAEIGVGLEPRCVAVHPNDQVAYVTNGISATVSVVDLRRRRVVRNVPTGTEPRGCALTDLRPAGTPQRDAHRAHVGVMEAGPTEPVLGQEGVEGAVRGGSQGQKTRLTRRS
jgi:YVTN family beta-propeller protein